MNAVPPQPKIYHIAHVDRLPHGHRPPVEVRPDWYY
jgi:hypothetical protein